MCFPVDQIQEIKKLQPNPGSIEKGNARQKQSRAHKFVESVVHAPAAKQMCWLVPPRGAPPS